MTKGFKRILSFGLLTSLVISLSACSSNKVIKPTHKAATSACLITSTTATPGSPDMQLAADLVEAQVVYGIKVRDAQIASGSNVPSRLLTELQKGCVLLVSSNTAFLPSLVRFATNHTKIMVLFVGGELKAIDQPANFRWVSDNPAISAKLAGFAAVEKGQDITVLYSKNYVGFDTFKTAFMSGVRSAQQFYSQVKVSVHQVNSKRDFKAQLSKLERPQTVVALVSSGTLTSIEDYTNLDVIGSDLQFGQTLVKYDPQIFAAIERNTKIYVLRAVSSLLARKVASSPKYRVADSSNELRFALSPTDEYLKFAANVTP